MVKEELHDNYTLSLPLPGQSSNHFNYILYKDKNYKLHQNYLTSWENIHITEGGLQHQLTSVKSETLPRGNEQVS